MAKLDVVPLGSHWTRLADGQIFFVEAQADADMYRLRKSIPPQDQELLISRDELLGTKWGLLFPARRMLR